MLVENNQSMKKKNTPKSQRNCHCVPWHYPSLLSPGVVVWGQLPAKKQAVVVEQQKQVVDGVVGENQQSMLKFYWSKIIDSISDSVMVHTWSCSFLYSDTTNKSSFLSLSLPTSTMHYLPQHNQSPTMLHTHSMLQANHIAHAPVLEVMGFNCHKDLQLQGFESALFGILQSMSLFVIWSILLPYALLNMYLLICLCLYLYKYSSCSMYFTSSNINLEPYNLLSSALSFFSALTPDSPTLSRTPKFEATIKRL